MKKVSFEKQIDKGTNALSKSRDNSPEISNLPLTSHKGLKKQVLYSPLARRLFSTLMDLSLVLFLLIPITMMVNRMVFVKKFGAILQENNVNVNDYKALTEAIQSPAFEQYANISTFIELMIPMLLVQLAFIILYFVLCWSFLGTTPIKYIMRLRVVDSTTFEKPTIFQSIRRVFGYILFPIGIWSIFFTTQKQMLHDRLAKTVVIRA